jgi:hypothetical protein
MRDSQRRHIERAERISAYMSSNHTDFPEGSKGAGFAAQIASELGRISTLDVDKVTSVSRRQQGSTGRRDLRESLRAQVNAVLNTAEVIGRDHPEIKGSFPRTFTDNSDKTLIAVARSYAAASAPFKALFIEYDLPADFAERMKGDADSLQHSIELQTEGVGARVNTNASIADSVRKIDDLADKLHVVVRNKHRNDPAKLATWESAHRLERPPRTKRNEDVQGKGGDLQTGGGDSQDGAADSQTVGDDPQTPQSHK